MDIDLVNLTALMKS